MRQRQLLQTEELGWRKWPPAMKKHLKLSAKRKCVRSMTKECQRPAIPGV